MLTAAALDRLVAARTREVAARAARHGLVPADVLAIEHLARAGEASAVQLARTVGLSSSGASALLRRLAHAGMVSRAAPRGPVRLTVAGQRLAAERDGIALDRALAALTGTDAAIAERVLLALADGAERDAEQAVTAAAAAAGPGPVPAPPRWG